MQLKTFVKVGNITNLSDARYCAGMGVDVLGFKLDDDALSVSSELFREISGWLSGTKFAGEFSGSNVEIIKNKAVELNLDYIQVSNFEVANELASEFNIIYKCELVSKKQLDELENQLTRLNSQIKWTLLETKDVDLQQTLSDLLPELTKGNSILKGYDITDSNVVESIENTNIAGIALYGSSEIRPGLKDYDELADILETLEVED